MKKIIAFDLDGTLAESKAPIDSQMVGLLKRLLEKYEVCIISGGDYPQIKTQCIDYLDLDETALSKLYIYPTCGTKMYLKRAGEWRKVYSNDFTEEEKKLILDELEEAIDYFGLRPEKTWGELIEDRDTQITYSALGQQAPVEAKKVWDPDFTKRRKVIERISPKLPNFSISTGGSSSVDITTKGVDKAFGIKKLMELTGVSMDEILFVGDALMEGGNDYPVKAMGVECVSVDSVRETKEMIRSLL